jgi:type IX secretion system PorP/SprF family membrane protein
MKNSTFFFLSFLCLSSLVRAQDIHFSNTEYVPLVLNPALAGANSGRQANLAYRTQWGQLGTSFRSAIASFDTRVGKQEGRKTNSLAIGFNFFNDRTPATAITNTAANFSLADHIKVNSTSQISLALNLGYAFRSFNESGGKWASQYNGVSYDAGLPSGETFGNQNFGFFDAGAGIVYTYAKSTKNAVGTNNKRVNLGFAAYHVNRPNDSFIQSNDARLPIRFTFFTNAELNVSGTKGSFLPGIYIQRQGTFSQYLLGAYYRYQLNGGSNYTGYEKPFSLYIGLFSRIQDSFIAKLMVEFDQYSVGYAHDFTVSPLTTNSGRLGASEIFIRYNMGDGGGFRNQNKPRS